MLAVACKTYFELFWRAAPFYLLCVVNHKAVSCWNGGMYWGERLSSSRFFLFQSLLFQ